VLVALIAVLVSASASPQAGPADRQVPVFVRAEVKPAVVREGDPIELTVTITNGLPRAIFHAGSWTEPNSWNGETIGVSIVDVYRNGLPGNLFVGRPEITLPGNVSGIGRVRIESGRSLSVRTDARKWLLRDGWLPGRYDITVRVDNLSIDHHSSLSVIGDPVAFRIVDEAGEAPSAGDATGEGGVDGASGADSILPREDHPRPSLDQNARAAAGREIDRLISAATTRPWPGEGYPVLPALSTELRGLIAGEIAASDAVRAAYEKLDAAARDNAEWFEGVAALEREWALWCLVSCLVHPHEDVQIRALRALERLGDGRAVPFLITYAEYMAVHEGGSENATIHGIVHSSVATTLSALTGVHVNVDGQDPEGLKLGVVKWRRWLANQPGGRGP
jgi:hypothetical protein